MSTVRNLDPVPFIDGITYGEGPRWHNDRLWFTDGPASRVCSTGVTGDACVEVEIERPSGLGWLPGGDLVVSTLLEAKVHYIGAGGDVAKTYDLSDFAWSTNDLLVTPAGHTYVDLYQITDTGMEGAIGLVEAEGGVRVVASGVTLPNGMGILDDGSTLVVSETNESRLLAFQIEDDGNLGAATVFADLGMERHPDGLCVDAQGAVWVGCYDTGEFLRVLAGGAVTHRVSTGGGWAVAPALGGADGRTLYMLINETTLEGLVAGESTGRIAQARVDVPGIGSP